MIYERRNWANKNSIEHHTSVPAAPFVAENLPAGTYLLTIERGKEYFTETRRIVVAEGEKRPVETVELRRWVNMAEHGWYCGESHLHRPLNELPVVMLAEDLNVALPLTYWVTKAFTAPSQGNKNQSGEIPDHLIMVDATHAIWPRNTEYEIFTVGEHQHTLGALFVLNHHSILSQGAPDWKPIAEQARAEGALMDMDKLDWPFGMDDAANANGQRAPNDVWVFGSTDTGVNWKPGGEFPKRLPGDLKLYPFGSIVRGHDESLRTIVYAVDEAHGNIESAWSMMSGDGGLTWAEPIKIAEGINESALLPLAGQDWLCIGRTSNRPAPKLGQELRQYRSTDDGRTWTDEGLIAGYHKHPPHLLRLQDNRLLLTYGNRQDGSIEARLSTNDGQTWGTAHKLYTTGPGDIGYPSTAQLPGGKLVTVFYAAQSPLHAAYHMGVIGWTAQKLR